MPTYVYCLVNASRELPAHVPRGLDGAPVRAVPAASLVAWASDVADARPAATVERVRAHDAVVRCALGAETPLPARFGQTFTDDAMVVARVRERETALHGALERVRGKVEMTVRVRPTLDVRDASPVVREGGSSGRAYLVRLRERHRTEQMWRDAADIIRRRVIEAAGSLVHAEAMATIAKPERWLSISHLIVRGDIMSYRAALDALAARDPTLSLAVSGPWAPYSFAEVARV